MGGILLDPKLDSKVPTKQTGKHSVTALVDQDQRPGRSVLTLSLVVMLMA